MIADALLGRMGRRVRGGPVFVAADLVFLSVLFLVTRALIFGIAAYVAASPESLTPGDLHATLLRWDARWYVEIARDGYHQRAGGWSTGDGTNWAFFPALPVLILAAKTVTGLGWNAAALLVANLLFLAGLLAFFAYTKDLFGRAFARHASLLFALSPFSIHHSTAMSEAVFVPALIGCLFLARRAEWARVAPLAIVLSATRIVGLFAVVPLGLIALRRFGFTRLLTLRPGTETALLALACLGLGPALYMLFLDWWTGDPLAFTHAQIAWKRQFKWPWETIYDELNFAVLGWPWAILNGWNLAFAAGAAALVPVLWRLRLGAEAVFVTVVILLGLFAGASTSLPRFMGALAPLVVAVAALSLGRPWRVVVPVVFLLLLILSTLGWTTESVLVM